MKFVFISSIKDKTKVGKIMTQLIEIKCPICCAVLKVKQREGFGGMSIICPVCKNKARFTDSKPVLIEHIDSIQPERKRCPWCGYESRSRTCPMCHHKNEHTNIISIGREDCDIIVADESKHINRHHADIKYMEYGDYFLFYDYSTKGTTIDGLQFHCGDIIRIPNDNHDHAIWLANNPNTALNWVEVKKYFSKLILTEQTDSAIFDKRDFIENRPTAINPNLRNEEETWRPPSTQGIIKTTVHGNKLSYLPSEHSRIIIEGKNFSFWSRFFGKKEKSQEVYSSVFAPAEVKLKSRMMVQVYLHLDEETEKVKALATEADKNAERRDYIPLQTKLKKGDKVDVVLNINGDSLLYDSSKSIIWQGSFCKCAFDYLVPSDLNVNELSCSVTLYVNGAIVGEMLFYTQIVDSPTQLNANVIAKPVKKLIISYSHNDLKSAEKIAKLYEGMDVDVFFDKHRLKAGYIYSEEIFNFIRKADTFVLCWSENAAQSEYVEKERKAALELAYPNRKPRENAQISIKPYNIQPYATPPKDMIEHYHFEEL